MIQGENQASHGNPIDRENTRGKGGARRGYSRTPSRSRRAAREARALIAACVRRRGSARARQRRLRDSLNSGGQQVVARFALGFVPWLAVPTRGQPLAIRPWSMPLTLAGARLGPRELQ